MFVNIVEPLLNLLFAISLAIFYLDWLTCIAQKQFTGAWVRDKFFLLQTNDLCEKFFIPIVKHDMKWQNIFDGYVFAFSKLYLLYFFVKIFLHFIVISIEISKVQTCSLIHQALSNLQILGWQNMWVFKF